MPLDSSKFERRINDLLAMFEKDIPVVAEEAAPRVQAMIASLSPTHDEEFQTIMYGEGGSGDVSLDGDRSSDTDGRTRFAKSPGTWLADIAVNPVNMNVVVNGTVTTVKFGNKPFLDASSVFQYTNIEGTTKTPITHQAGPYFDNFEAGASYVVVPSHVVNKNYPLRPYEDPRFKIYEFPKSVSAHRAYLPGTLFPVFRDAVISALAELDFNNA